MKKLLYIFAAGLLLTACGGESNLDVVGMVAASSDHANSRFAQSMLYNQQHGVDTVHVADNEYHFYVMTDSHVDFSTNNLDQFVDDYLSDTEAAPFCLHLGDLINGTHHYDTCLAHVARIWEGTGDTCFVTPGNHDLYFGQWTDYVSFLKTGTYYFVVKTPNFKDLYICLDSGDGTLGIDQRKWLEQTLSEAQDQQFRHIIVFTHTHFFKLDASQGHTSNYALEESYELFDMFSRYGVELVLQGHDHCRSLNYFKGVAYLIVDALEDHYYNAYYAIVDVNQLLGWRFVPVGPQDPDKNGERVPGVPHL
jgi:3',5'-cyclic AMP phosphodiesterase CpdA